MHLSLNRPAAAVWWLTFQPRKQQWPPGSCLDGALTLVAAIPASEIAVAAGTAA